LPAIETNFGTSTPYSLGVEEEFQLVELDTFELVSRAVPVLEALSGEVAPARQTRALAVGHRGHDQDRHRCCEVVSELADLRERLAHTAAEHETAILSAGTHPFSRYAEQDVTDEPRYAELAASYGWLAARQIVFGLHIHVGMSSAGKAIACANGLRNELPELLALSANSPFWQGRPTGLASTRAKIVEGLPRTGIPPVLDSFADFELLVEQGEAHRLLPRLHPHLVGHRPHPQLGTIEIRICDAQTRIENVAAIVALVQSLAAAHGSNSTAGSPRPCGRRCWIEENKWRALRDGLDARLIDLEDDTERSAREAIWRWS